MAGIIKKNPLKDGEIVAVTQSRMLKPDEKSEEREGERERERGRIKIR